MFDRFLERLCHAFGIASALAVMAIMFVTAADALGRSFINSPVDGASEFAANPLVVVVFLGLAASQRSGANFKVELLTRFLPPGGQRFMDVLWRVIVLGFLITVAWLSSKEALHSSMKLEASYGVVKFPLWPGRIVLAIGMWVLTAQILLETILLLRGKQPNAPLKTLNSIE